MAEKEKEAPEPDTALPLTASERETIDARLTRIEEKLEAALAAPRPNPATVATLKDEKKKLEAERDGDDEEDEDEDEDEDDLV